MKTNILKFSDAKIEKATAKGSINSLSFDIELVAEPFESKKKNAPTHMVYGLSPAGNKIRVGAIWKKTSKAGNKYYTLSLKGQTVSLNANLGKYANQEDPAVQAIIPWEPKTA